MPEVVFHSLLFADKVITEDNRKKCIIGTFNVINMQGFPGQTPPFFLYACFSNIEGIHEFSLNLVRDESPDVVLSIGGDISAKTPETVIELSFPVQVLFPKPGNYNLTLSLDGKQIAGRVLNVKLSKKR